MYSTTNSFASLNIEHLLPHDTINAIVKSASGSHGIVEMTFGAPVLPREEEANNGISVTGTEDWVWIELVESKDATEAKQYVFRITVKKVKRNEKGEDVGKTEDVVEERVRGVEEEFRSPRLAAVMMALERHSVRCGTLCRSRQP